MCAARKAASSWLRSRVSAVATRVWHNFYLIVNLIVFYS